MSNEAVQVESKASALEQVNKLALDLNLKVQYNLDGSLSIFEKWPPSCGDGLELARLVLAIPGGIDPRVREAARSLLSFKR